MKVTMEIDCTPLEARQFFGLPDVQPMQQAMMAELEKNVMKEAQRYSPDALLKVWFAGAPQADWFRSLFAPMLNGGPKSDGTPKER